MNYKKSNKIVDCHYCEYAVCDNAKSDCDCYVDDFSHFDHKVKDSKREAIECNSFSYCDIFPKN